MADNKVYHCQDKNRNPGWDSPLFKFFSSFLAIFYWNTLQGEKAVTEHGESQPDLFFGNNFTAKNPNIVALKINIWI